MTYNSFVDYEVLTIVGFTHSRRRAYLYEISSSCSLIEVR